MMLDCIHCFRALYVCVQYVFAVMGSCTLMKSVNKRSTCSPAFLRCVWESGRLCVCVSRSPDGLLRLRHNGAHWISGGRVESVTEWS